MNASEAAAPAPFSAYAEPTSAPVPETPVPERALVAVAVGSAPDLTVPSAAPASLLATAVEHPAAFGAFLAQTAARRQQGHARRIIVVASIVGHAALVAFAAVHSLWLVDELSPRTVTVSLSLPVAAPPPAPPPLARRASPTPRPTPVRPQPRPVTQPMLVAQAVPTPPAEAEEAAPGSDSEAGVQGGVEGGVVGGEVAPVPPPPSPPPVAAGPTPQQIAGMHAQYLARLRQHLAPFHRYPPEAESLGLSGRVTVRASLDGAGRLLGARVEGTCPDEILCEAALASLRSAAPFPAPPAALGAAIDVSVPFNYALD